MPVFLFYFAGAGLVAGGAYLFDEGNKKRAREEMRRRQALEAELLTGEIALEDLRAQARAAGLDPQQVVEGYLALQSGHLSLDDVQRLLSIA
jgi:hypothetical protein